MSVTRGLILSLPPSAPSLTRPPKGLTPMAGLGEETAADISGPPVITGGCPWQRGLLPARPCWPEWSWVLGGSTGWSAGTLQEKRSAASAGASGMQRGLCVGMTFGGTGGWSGGNRPGPPASWPGGVTGLTVSRDLGLAEAEFGVRGAQSCLGFSLRSAGQS